MSDVNNPYAPPVAAAAEPAASAVRPGDFDIGAALSTGWRGMANNFGISIAITLLYLVIHTIGSNVPFLNFIYIAFFNFAIAAGISFVGMKLADSGLGRNVTPEVGDLFKAFQGRYLSVLGAGWLLMLIIGVPVAIAVGIGMVLGGEDNPQLLVIPVAVVGLPLVYVALRVFFAFYLILDQDMGAIDALKRSWEITNGKVLKILALSIIAFFCIMFGVLLLIVGIFPAMAFAMGAMGAAYRGLSST